VVPALFAAPVLGGVRDAVDSGPGPQLRFAYRRQLIRALNVKLRRGEISRAKYWEIRKASWNVTYLDAVIEEVVHAAEAAGTFIEDVKEWIQYLVKWLIDNWPTVLKILLSLLVLI
jgi:hypothetical protein